MHSSVTKLSSRELLRVHGLDAFRFLQGLLTNDMNKLSTSTCTTMYAAFLTSKGRILSDCNVHLLDKGDFWLEYDKHAKLDLLKHLNRYKLRMKVTLEEQTNSYDFFSILPPLHMKNGISKCYERENLLQNTIKELGQHARAIYLDPRGEEFGVRAILDINQKKSGDTLASVHQLTDSDHYSNRRMILGVAEGEELADLIPLESNLDLLGGVSFEKGCYVGQELTARTQFKGTIRKRIVPVALIPFVENVFFTGHCYERFESVNTDGLIPLYDYMMETKSSPQLASGTKIIRSDSDKAVGTIITTAPGMHVALAMFRLEYLNIRDHDLSGKYSMNFMTEDGSYHAIPYKPTWWKYLNLQTGKPMSPIYKV